MGRPIETGSRYFPMDVDFLYDQKIKIVRVRYGVKGVMLYISLLCAIYREGYYIAYNDDLVCTMAIDLGVGENLIREVVSFFCERSLFDGKLFAADKIITSAGIQERYQTMIKGKAKHRPVKVCRRYWLLDSDETLPFIKFSDNEDFSPKNDGFCGNNGDYSGNNACKEKEKEKNEIERERGAGDKTPGAPSPARIAFGVYGNVLLTLEEYDALKSEYRDLSARIDRLSEYLRTSGKSYADHAAVIRKWAREDGNGSKTDAQSSFDTEEFFQAALARSYAGNGGGHDHDL